MEEAKTEPLSSASMLRIQCLPSFSYLICGLPPAGRITGALFGAGPPFDFSDNLVHYVRTDKDLIKDTR